MLFATHTARDRKYGHAVCHPPTQPGTGSMDMLFSTHPHNPEWEAWTYCCATHPHSQEWEAWTYWCATHPHSQEWEAWTYWCATQPRQPGMGSMDKLVCHPPTQPGILGSTDMLVCPHGMEYSCYIW